MRFARPKLGLAGYQGICPVRLAAFHLGSVCIADMSGWVFARCAHTGHKSVLSRLGRGFPCSVSSASLTDSLEQA
eukprot:3059810-Prorocentrum_lima.AAC.1